MQGLAAGPALGGAHEVDIGQARRRARLLRDPGRSRVDGMQDDPVAAHRPTGRRAHEGERGKILARAGVLRAPRHPGVHGVQDGAAVTRRPARRGVEEGDGAQTRPHPRLLHRPGDTAVRGLHYEALGSDGPAGRGAHEVDSVQLGSVVRKLIGFQLHFPGRSAVGGVDDELVGTGNALGTRHSPAVLGVDEIDRGQVDRRVRRLCLPRLAAVRGPDDGAAIADRPADPGVDETDGVQAVGAAVPGTPGDTAVPGLQDHAMTTHGPGVEPAAHGPARARVHEVDRRDLIALRQRVLPHPTAVSRGDEGGRVRRAAHRGEQ